MSDLVSVIVESSHRIHTFPSIAVQQCSTVKLVKFRAMCLHWDIWLHTLLTLRGRGTLLGIITFAIFIEACFSWLRVGCWQPVLQEFIVSLVVHVCLCIHSTDQTKPPRDNNGGSEPKPCSSAQQWSMWTTNMDQIPAPVLGHNNQENCLVL